MRGDGQTLHFHATDAPGEWLARREQDGIVAGTHARQGDVAVRGPAADLLLVISRRRVLAAAPALEVFGRSRAVRALDRPHGLGHRLTRFGEPRSLTWAFFCAALIMSGFRD